MAPIMGTNSSTPSHLEPNRRPVAVVTGASRGLGAVLARLLAARGYDLVLTARGASDLEATAVPLRALGGSVPAVAGDVASAAHREEIATAVGAFGTLDLLVNNASELGGIAPLTEAKLDRARQVLEVNVLAPLALVQRLLPWLERARGLVVNVSSDAARGGYPGWGVYGASKAALDLLSLTLAGELRERGVAVVAVDPGDMRTRMHQEAFPGEDISDRPLPQVTEPFWSWLLAQGREQISGQRFQAQERDWKAA
jgi:NAD(P)-dependent dehydrogenase (short-subunit alcohol dehydrogenase family)